jgi:hypothetical protein
VSTSTKSNPSERLPDRPCETGQQLRFHPHLHCVVTGGGLPLDGQRWVAGRRQYFLPVKVLAKLFRGKFLAAPKTLYQAELLTITGRKETRGRGPFLESVRVQRIEPSCLQRRYQTDPQGDKAVSPGAEKLPIRP